MVRGNHAAQEVLSGFRTRRQDVARDDVKIDGVTTAVTPVVLAEDRLPGDATRQTLQAEDVTGHGFDWFEDCRLIENRWDVVSHALFIFTVYWSRLQMD